MKSVLISIRPEWVEKIVNGEKTIEVRKSAPKEVPFKAYVYVTKDKSYLYCDMPIKEFYLDNGGYKGGECNGIKLCNGKVIGEFICDKVDEYTFSHYEAEYRVTHVEQKAMCLNQPELIRYGKGKTLYGWHISELKIYDEPRKLSEFRKPLKSVYCNRWKQFGCDKRCVGFDGTDFYCRDYWNWADGITRPPQSWQYVEELEK